MKHLSMEDIVKYVDADKVNAETMALISRVNAHTGHCEKCRKKLDAYQTVIEELDGGEAALEGEAAEFDFFQYDEIAENNEIDM